MGLRVRWPDPDVHRPSGSSQDGSRGWGGPSPRGGQRSVSGGHTCQCGARAPALPPARSHEAWLGGRGRTEGPAAWSPLPTPGSTTQLLKIARMEGRGGRGFTRLPKARQMKGRPGWGSGCAPTPSGPSQREDPQRPERPDPHLLPQAAVRPNARTAQRSRSPFLGTKSQTRQSRKDTGRGVKRPGLRGPRLAQPVDQETPDLRVLSSSPALGIEITLKKKTDFKTQFLLCDLS